MAFSEIRPSAFYGKKTLPILRDIPSDSEDSELSDDEDEGRLLVILLYLLLNKILFYSGNAGRPN